MISQAKEYPSSPGLFVKNCTFYLSYATLNLILPLELTNLIYGIL